ncbi:MIP family channel protein [Nocardioides sp. SOB44]|uniref:MIP family channel protein n=1 Tax=Nocardioides cremeus TaxID=3058044 RepID=A0ABT8TQ82_9ACTN|nr:MIP family channel protein [Nocardioides cremeus]MDO3394442.1 MIP family channel protein [Nocardioides cremeus]
MAATNESTGARQGRAAAGTAAFFAEVVGTFMLVFAGTAAVLATQRLDPSEGFSVVDDVAIALAFAFGILAAVYTVAEISGAHINPAVTIALAAVGRFPWRVVPAYVLAQLIGGLLAGLMNWLMFGDVAKELALGGTQPGEGVSWWTALVTEFVITAVLLVVVMATAVYEGAPGAGTFAGLAIGLWVGAAVLLALPISGASLNPARTLGPDIVAGAFPGWWIYVVGPVVGGIAGAALWTLLLERGDKQVVESMGADDDD